MNTTTTKAGELTGSRFTPGPWRVREAFTSGEPVEWLVHAGREDICTLMTHDRQGEANARLIAAAPDLLGLARDGALQFARLEGENLIRYARTFAVIAERLISKAVGERLPAPSPSVR